MDIETYRSYCLAKPGVTEHFPFDDDVLVFKVMNKMFALASVSTIPFRVNLKCEPDLALELRELHDEIIPGYHMNKQHWNTVYFESGNLSDDFLVELIDKSYRLIVESLPKKRQAELSQL